MRARKFLLPALCLAVHAALVLVTRTSSGVLLSNERAIICAYHRPGPSCDTVLPHR